MAVSPLLPSRSQECRRHDGDSIGAAVGPRAGMHDHGIDTTFSEMLPKPEQVLHVVILNRRPKLHLDRQNPLIGPFHDQVDFPTPAMLPQRPGRVQRGATTHRSRHRQTCAKTPGYRAARGVEV